ncbi:MerR family transcriptional regulator [Hyphobacterium sp. HN65]|uniref:MerR family transcriptional regulator n=1 Tax=Hyphobacterium lacteum TaxID=3116575 RepID=A0ABU7LM66_9PROT|nr:MerR family transcriptional regulator [Hyphobacterium sp. HN65]MEE2525011.1 MerR family transcriptional regulator [Hyphobacterium sp. HN65]
MTKKAPDAYRTISEAADELDLPAHVLRFWESRFSQIKPVKRAGGRRLYRPGDIQLLRGIRTLLYEQGYTIKGAQKYLREHGVADVAGLASGDGDVPATPAIADRYVPAATDGDTAGLRQVIRKLAAAKAKLDETLAARATH